MPTPNFNLPTISGTSPISIVNDMNGLAQAVDSAIGNLATVDAVEQAKTIANNASQAAASATSAATAATKAAKDATAAAETATATAANAASNASNASATATKAANTASDTQEALAAAKPVLLWSGSVKPGQAITVTGIGNWKMVAVGLSGSAGDSGSTEILAPGCINADLADKQLKGGGMWGNSADEIRIYGYAATITGSSVNFTSNNYFSVGGAGISNWGVNRNINAIYGLVKA